ncbi:hypothetical protein EH204_09045 [Pectobacterium carotovorum subsp. carotovorum]|nr:hypothetical protein EH204_09045 [Pectobacterium carotovorum subsp. carotovorum]
MEPVVAKKNESSPPQSEIDHILYCRKIVSFTGAKWNLKPPPGRSPTWLQISLVPTDDDGIPISGLYFMLQWRPAEAESSDGYGDCPKISLVVLYNGRRIFAVDSYPFDRHTNRYEVEHPDFIKSILGPHYHLYFEEAGPNEIALQIPDQIALGDLQGYWKFFCSKLNVAYNGELPSPTQEDSGQMSLL